MASLSRLQPFLRRPAEKFVAFAHRQDARFHVTSTVRTQAQQRRLYEKYRRGMSDLPAAPPGQSDHEYGLAFDMHRLGVDPFHDDELARLGGLWNELGGKWDARDPVHFGVRHAR